MDIYIPNRKLWMPDNVMAELSPPRQNRILADMRRICTLTPDILMMMGAAGGAVGGDETSYAFDGTGDYLTVPDHADWDYGTGDFTIDLWLYLNAINKYQVVFDSGSAGTGSRKGVWLRVTSGNDWEITVNDVLKLTSTISDPVVSTWYHLAVVRASGTLYLFKDGVDISGGGVASTENIAGQTETFKIGIQQSLEFSLDGKVDEFRVSNSARWTSGFTPQSTQYTSDSNTKLLIHCGETKTGTTGSGATFTDSSGNHTVTENGNAIEDTVYYKFGGGVGNDLIPQGTGTALGNMTANGGLAAAFDGNNNQAATACATRLDTSPGYIGKDWGSGATKTVTMFKCYGSNNQGMDQGTGNITVTLQGSTDNFSASIVNLGSVGPTADANSLLMEVLSGLTETPYRYHRLKIETTGGSHVYCAEAEFYGG